MKGLSSASSKGEANMVAVMLQRLKQLLENESDQNGGGEHLALLGTFLRRNLHREFVAKETNVFIQT
jgi:hypothetical protein